MKRNSIFRIMVLGLITVLLLSFSNVSTTHGEGSPFSPNDYRQYLEKLNSEGDQGALEILNKFDLLTEKEQSAFVTFLYSPDYVESFQNGIEASLQNEQTHSDNSTVILNGIEIPVEVKVISSESFIGNVMSIAATTRIETTATIPLTILGIETSQLYTTLVSETDGSVATRSLEVRQGHRNYNPALWITEVSTNTPGYVSDNYAFGRGTFNIAASVSLGQISSTWQVEVKASNENHKYGRYSTSHPDAGSANGVWYQI